MKYLLLLLLLALCVVSDFQASSAEPPQLPQKLSLYIGHYGGGRYYVELADGKLQYKVLKSQKETVETITPTAEQWIAFEIALDTLKVWDWKKTYEIPSEDGTQWSLAIIDDKKQVESNGNNAYPPNFAKYTAAVKALLGGREFQ